MNVLKSENINELLVLIARELLENGKITRPRGQETRELINQTLILTNPLNNLITLKSRKYNVDYLRAELEWYKNGELNIDKIKEHASLWEQLVDKNGKINSNYGYYIWKQKTSQGVSQWEWVKNKLIQDKDSRQAVININQPCHKYDTKDFPCTLTIQYLIRDNALISIVNMRSNDLIYGTCFDVPFFTILQENMWRELRKTHHDLKLGAYYHNAASLHVYFKHYLMLENMSNDRVFESKSFKFDFI